jgi:ABC-type transport system substrate-binding protein
MSAAREIELLQTPPGDDGRGFDMALVEFGQGGLADPDPYPFWHESQVARGQNFSGFVDRDISEMLEVARRDANGVRRADLYKAFQQAFLDRAAAILLYNPLYHYAVSCQVQGVQVVIYTEPADRFRNMQDWRIIPADQVEQYCSQ